MAPTRVRVRLLLILVVLALAVGACSDSGSSSADGSSASDSSTGAVEPAPAVDGGGDLDGTVTASAEPIDADIVDSASPIGADREVIETANLVVRTDDVDEGSAAVRRITTAAGGLVASESRGQGGDPQPLASPEGVSQADATIVVRIPPDQFDRALEQFGELGTVSSIQRSVADVTAQVVDLDGRLATAEASADRLRALLAQATTVADVVAVETELTRREAEVESLQGQRRVLADQVDLATVTISLTEEEPVATSDRPTFLDGLSAGWRGLVTAITIALVGLGAAVPFAPIAVVALVVWRVRARRVQSVAGS